MAEFLIRPTQAVDQDWIRQIVNDQWGAEMVVAHGTVYRPHELPGFVAEEQDQQDY